MMKITDEVVEAALDSACLSYRHDFSLLPEQDRETLRRTAKWWLEAWKKALPHLSQGAVRTPKGWVLVPREPTDQMLDAGSDAADGHFDIDADNGPWLRSSGFYSSYAAMLAFAPPPPVGVVDESVRWEDVREFIYHRAEQLKSQTPRQVFWALADDMSRKLRGVRALDALASHEPVPDDDECETCVGTGLVEDAATSLSLGKGGFKPCPDCAPTDTQEGMSEASEVVAWLCEDQVMPDNHSVTLDGALAAYREKYGEAYKITPLVRQSALTACRQEAERLRKDYDAACEEAAKSYSDKCSAEARIAELVKALEPFANAKITYLDAPDGREVKAKHVHGLVYGDFRRARAALGGQSNE